MQSETLLQVAYPVLGKPRRGTELSFGIYLFWAYAYFIHLVPPYTHPVSKPREKALLYTQPVA